MKRNNSNQIISPNKKPKISHDSQLTKQQQSNIDTAIDVLKKHKLYYLRPTVVRHLHKKAIEKYPDHAITIAEGIVALNSYNICTSGNIDAITEAKNYARDVASALEQLKKLLQSESTKNEWRNTILKNPDQAKSLAYCLKLLNESMLAAKDTLDPLFVHAQFAKQIAKALMKLVNKQKVFNQNRAKKDFPERDILSTAVVLAIINYPEDAFNLVKIISKLAKIDGSQYIDRICQQPQHASTIYKGLDTLKQSNNLTPCCTNLVFKSGSHAKDMANAIVLMKNNALWKTGIVTALDMHLAYAKAIASCLLVLKKRNLANLNVVMPSIRQSPKAMTQAIKTLKENDILSDSNINVICKYDKQADKVANSIAMGINFLKKLNILTENLGLLLENPLQANSIGEAFSLLKVTNLYNPDNCQLIMNQKIYSKTIAVALRALSNAKKLTQANLEQICIQPKNALFAAEQLRGKPARMEGNRTYFRPEAQDFCRIRVVSRLFAQPKKEDSLIKDLPAELLAKIASDTGLHGSLEAEVTEHIAIKSLIRP